MTIETLKERIQTYQDAFDIKLTRKLPIAIVLNGRSFKKLTSLLDKPFSQEFIELMCAVMIKLAQEIDGNIFIYSFNDEIVIIARNDQNIGSEPWCGNKIQKIVSTAAAIATLEFNRIAEIGNVKLIGDPIFTSNTFLLPNITETINFLISKQQQAFQTSISMSCFYELVKKFDINIVKETLANKTIQEKVDILQEKCNININNYPLSFTRGIASYRALKVVKAEYGDELKNKITINTELPIFSKDQDFLSNIFTSGKDVIRLKKDF